MTETGMVGLILLILNVLISYKGFNDRIFLDNYMLEVDKVLLLKEYRRIVSSGFLHVSWSHLILNMLSLLAFSGGLEEYLGGFKFLLIYFGSLIGGNLFSIFIHRNHGDYSSIGGSGAVCGIIFASIALFPGIGVGIFGIPLSIPGWLYGLFFVVYSIYGIKSQKDNVGHEAHLGGALIGIMIAIMLNPIALKETCLTITIIVVATIIFIYLIVTRPELLLIDNKFFNTNKNYYSIDQRYNEERNNKQKEIDFILDKINSKGLNSLSKKEREKLDAFSKE